MDITSEILHRLSSKTRMRSLFSDADFLQMEKIIARIQDVTEQKRQDYEVKQEKLLVKQKQVEEIMATLLEKGLSLADLGITADALEEPKPRRNVSKHKFVYENNAGDLVEWYGSSMGRLPAEFKAYLERTGSKRADCIIEEETA